MDRNVAEKTQVPYWDKSFLSKKKLIIMYSYYASNDGTVKKDLRLKQWIGNTFVTLAEQIGRKNEEKEF